jgi:hypothetical protein
MGGTTKVCSNPWGKRLRANCIDAPYGVHRRARGATAGIMSATIELRSLPAFEWFPSFCVIRLDAQGGELFNARYLYRNW